jgi:hypothetical protein
MLGPDSDQVLVQFARSTAVTAAVTRGPGNYISREYETPCVRIVTGGGILASSILRSNARNDCESRDFSGTRLHKSRNLSQQLVIRPPGGTADAAMLLCNNGADMSICQHFT